MHRANEEIHIASYVMQNMCLCYGRSSSATQFRRRQCVSCDVDWPGPRPTVCWTPTTRTYVRTLTAGAGWHWRWLLIDWHAHWDHHAIYLEGAARVAARIAASHDALVAVAPTREDALVQGQAHRVLQARQRARLVAME